MGGRRTTIAASAAFVGLALIAMLIVGLHGVGSGGSAAREASPARAAAGSTPLAMPTPTARPTVVAAAAGHGTQPGQRASAATPAQPRRTTAPVAFDRMVSARPGVTVGAVAVRTANVKSHLPGETSGASYVVTVRVTNAGSTSVNLRDAVVNLYVGTEGTPAIETTTASKPVRATLAAHHSATGRYVFRRPAGADAPLRVEVDLGVTSVVVPFQGPAPAQS